MVAESANGSKDKATLARKFSFPANKMQTATSTVHGNQETVQDLLDSYMYLT